MNVEDTPREQLPDLSADVQGGPSLQQALEKGRARRRRRAAATGAAATAVVTTAAVVSVAAITGSGVFAQDNTASQDDDRRAVTAPEDMPGNLKQAVRAQLPDGTKVVDVRLRAYDEGGKPLPRGEWDESADWSASFVLKSGEKISAQAFHAGSETDGPGRRICRRDERSGLYFSCEASEGPDGSEVYARESAFVGSRLVARPGSDTPGTPNLDQVVPDRVGFDRQVEVQPGGDYLLKVYDSVRAPTYQEATSEWTLDLAALREIATDEDLLKDPAGDRDSDEAGVSEVEPQKVRSDS